MKKGFLVVLCVLLLVVVVGCGKKSENEVVCSKTTTDGDKSVTEEGVFKLDSDNKVTGADATYTFSDKDVAASYCSLFKMGIDSKYSDLISCSDTKVTIKNLEKIAGDSDDSTKLVGMTKDELIKFETGEGYTCK
jgi:uncharacterized lipoprotein YehR (DUF1307 family)